MKHKLDDWIRGEEIREGEYRNSFEVGPTVHFCELEQGLILGESECEDIESLMDYVESPNQHQNVLIEVSIEVVMNIYQGGDDLFKDRKEKQNLNYVMK